jgi:hypothetical protein
MLRRFVKETREDIKQNAQKLFTEVEVCETFY